MARTQQGDLESTAFVFQLIKKICKKYKYQFRSDDLFREMNYMIDLTAEPNQATLQQCVDHFSKNIQDKATADTFLSVANSNLLIILYCMGQDEIPDFYAEKQDLLLPIYQALLDIDTPYECEPLIKCRAKVVRIITLYSIKFNDEFTEEKRLHFFERIWTMVANNKVGSTKKYDRLVQAVVRYMDQMTVC